MNERAGQYIESRFFFGKGTRGGFVIYERGDGAAHKRCLRAEARINGRNPITLELDADDMAELVAVLRGARSSFIKEIKRPKETPKTLTIFYNARSQPPNAWVMVAQEGTEKVTIGFNSGVACAVQYQAITMLKPHFAGMSDTCLWQMLSATGRAAPANGG